MPAVDQTVGGVTIVTQRNIATCPRRRRPDVAVPARYRNRPTPIRVAIYKTWEVSDSLGFTKSTTAVLQAIIAAGVSAEDPLAPIFARKTTLAKMAQCSEVTVYRAMRELEKSGWIIRSAQVRLEDGSMDIGLVSITPRCAYLIGLMDNSQEVSLIDKTSQKQSELTPEGIARNETAQEELKPTDGRKAAAPSDPAKENSRRAASSTEPCGQMKGGLTGGPIYRGEQRVYPKASVNNQSTLHDYVRIDGRSVARELVWLIEEKRLTFGALFQLQTLAKQVPGQTLSDFVAYRSERIRQLPTTSDCYRYLKKLISDGIDARYLCAQRAKNEHRLIRRYQRDQAAKKREAWCRARHETTYINPKTQVTYRINAIQGLLEVGEQGIPSSRPSLIITSQFIKAVDEGRLVPFVRDEAPINRELGIRRLDDLAAKFPWLRRLGKARSRDGECA